MPLACRFYEQRFPEVDDVVMVNVRSIAEMGAYVTLLEYNNIEGLLLILHPASVSHHLCHLFLSSFPFLSPSSKSKGMILLSELSRRRIRSINKLIRVGRNECVVVLRVDREKGYIDLSKRRVSTEEARKCEEKYNKARAVNSILRHVAELTKMVMEK